MKRVIYFVVLILGLSVLGLSVNSCSCSENTKVVCDRCGRTLKADERVPHSTNAEGETTYYCPECSKKWHEEQDAKFKREQMKKLGIDYW